jgi:hypothetical protein
MAPAGTPVKRTDLDKDGDPDILETLTINNTPIRWIDDDDDMKWTDTEGDTDSDCLMIDRDLMELDVRKQNQEFLNSLDKAYFSGNWKLVGKL